MLRMVFDTHIFLGLLMPLILNDTSFLDRDNVVVVVNDAIVDEYTGRARSHGYTGTIIASLQQVLGNGS